MGEYHFCRQEQDIIAALATAAARGRQGADKLQTSALAAELALASARTKEAELRAVAAQAELADRVGLPAGDRNPLPADKPHIGPYTTYFNVLFASRAAPPRLQLIERTLPLRCKAIDVRAEAVQAASDSLSAAQDALGRREIDAEQVAERLLHLSRQRKAFLDAVRLYNQEIAEYAMGVADPSFQPAAIQSMLIKSSATSTASPPAKPNSTSTPGAAAGNVEAPTTGRLPGKRSLLKSDPVAPDAETRLKPPDAGDELAQAAPPDEAPADYENYAALLELSPPKRTHRLARALHWDRPSTDSAEPLLTLEQCLSLAPAADRRRALEAYWMAREQAARCQVVSDRNDQLTALYPAALRAARRPGGAEAMLDLRACQQAAEADLLDNQALLLARRMELGALVGRGTSFKEWPMPSTLPHGGRYETKVENQPQTLAGSPVVQNLATLVPGLYAALEDRAEAIVHLDSRRAATVEAFEATQHRVDLWEPLELVARQASESLAFLSTLTRYNLSIADYALAILPTGISPPELTSSLVVQSP